MLRSRRSRSEEALEGPLGEALGGARVPDPIVGRADGSDPEHEALLADGVGLALLVVLETLSPAERLAFVLHDTFGVPFAEIVPIVGRSPAAARQLASRARNRVRGAAPAPETDLASQREVVDAFLAASRGGDFGALLAVLDPEVVLRADNGAAGASRLVRGARAVANQALTYSRLAPFSRPALVNGAPGAATAPGGVPRAIMGFTVAGGKIIEIDILADPERLGRLDLRDILRILLDQCLLIYTHDAVGETKALGSRGEGARAVRKVSARGARPLCRHGEELSLRFEGICLFL
jgi:RNA polymerase sigma-70 factor (ECF subfamily)